MTNSILPRAIGLVAAISTTWVLFSAVVSLADSDKAAVTAAQATRGAQVAGLSATR